MLTPPSPRLNLYSYFKEKETGKDESFQSLPPYFLFPLCIYSQHLDIWLPERESSFRLLYQGKYAIDWVRNDWILGSLYGSGPPPPETSVMTSQNGSSRPLTCLFDRQNLDKDRREYFFLLLYQLGTKWLDTWKSLWIGALKRVSWRHKMEVAAHHGSLTFDCIGD